MVPASCRLFQRRRAAIRVTGLAIPHVYGVHNNSLNNLERAVIERVLLVPTPEGLKTPPTPAPGHFSRTLAGVHKTLLRNLPTTAPESYDQFVSQYEGRKRTIYRNAVESLKVKPLTERDARCAMFLKCEKVLAVDEDGRPLDKAPRLISPRHPRYNVEVGLFLKSLEKVVFKAIDRVFGSPTVFKGLNSSQQGAAMYFKWSRFRRPVAVSTDFSRFDQHIGVDALKWEHSVYTACFRGSDKARLRYLLSLQLRNKGVARANDGAVKVDVVGRRMSGDMNTSTGNCLLACSMALAYLQRVGIRAELVNNGDDCVFIMEKSDLHRFQCGLSKWYLRMGFSIKAEEPVEVFEKVVFCQTQPLWTPEGWIMCRQGLRAMAKDATSIHCGHTLDQLRTYFSELGTMGLTATGGVPVFQEFYRALQRMGSGKRYRGTSLPNSGLYFLSKGMKRAYGPVHDRTRLSFWLAFGIDPALQVALEDELKRWTCELTVRDNLCGNPDHTFLRTVPATAT